MMRIAIMGFGFMIRIIRLIVITVRSVSFAMIAWTVLSATT